MQFREAGKRIQVLAYAGYDKEKRRSVVQLLGSIDKYDLTPTVKLLEKLTDAQKIELQEYIESIRQSRTEKHRQHVAKNLHSDIKNVADSLTEGVYEPDAAWAASVYHAIDEITRAMRRSGFARPKKSKKSDPSADGQSHQTHQKTGLSFFP